MGTWFVDFAGLLDERGLLKASLEGAHLERALHASVVVEAVTASGAPDGFTAAACRCRRARAGCTGRLQVKRGSEPAILWRCSACGDGGVVRGFEGSAWDLSAVLCASDSNVNLRVTLETLDAVANVALGPALRAVSCPRSRTVEKRASGSRRRS